MQTSKSCLKLKTLVNHLQLITIINLKVLDDINLNIYDKEIVAFR